MVWWRARDSLSLLVLANIFIHQIGATKSRFLITLMYTLCVSNCQLSFRERY